MDERRRWIRDPQDDEPATKLLFTTDEDGELTGTARIWPWRPGAIPDVLFQPARTLADRVNSHEH